MFDDVKRALPGLLDRAVALQRPPLVPRGRFRKADQLALVHELADRMGFDWELGRVDESAHPFTLGCNRDVRITVRYVDWKETIFATIHELGHALYVLGLPAEPADQPVADDCGLSVHERAKVCSSNVSSAAVTPSSASPHPCCCNAISTAAPPRAAGMAARKPRPAVAQD